MTCKEEMEGFLFLFFSLKLIAFVKNVTTRHWPTTPVVLPTYRKSLIKAKRVGLYLIFNQRLPATVYRGENVRICRTYRTAGLNYCLPFILLWPNPCKPVNVANKYCIVNIKKMFFLYFIWSVPILSGHVLRSPDLKVLSVQRLFVRHTALELRKWVPHMNNMSGRWSALRSHVHHRCWWNHMWALLICVDPAGPVFWRIC